MVLRPSWYLGAVFSSLPSHNAKDTFIDASSILSALAPMSPCETAANCPKHVAAISHTVSDICTAA